MLSLTNDLAGAVHVIVDADLKDADSLPRLQLLHLRGSCLCK